MGAASIGGQQFMYFPGVESAESQTRAIVVDLELATVVASARAPYSLVEGVPIGSWIPHLEK
jgi:hypothetical protein